MNPFQWFPFIFKAKISGLYKYILKLHLIECISLEIFYGQFEIFKNTTLKKLTMLSNVYLVAAVANFFLFFFIFSITEYLLSLDSSITHKHNNLVVVLYQTLNYSVNL